VVFDLCDNLFFIGDDVEGEEAGRLQERATRTRALIEIADLVTVSTPALARVIESIRSRRSTVIPDPVVPPARWSRWRAREVLSRLQRRLRPETSPLEVVWYGNHAFIGVEGGMSDLLQVVPYLQELHAERPLRLTVISNSREMFEQFLTPHLKFPACYIEWRHYAQFCALLPQFDLCVIPFGRNPVSECKSNNRITLALMQGVPVVADGIESYREFALYCRLDNWREGLREYSASRVLRNSDARAGARYAQKHYNLQKIAGMWQAALQSLPSGLD
jgi:hypothetical protein